MLGNSSWESASFHDPGGTGSVSSNHTGQALQQDGKTPPTQGVGWVASKTQTLTDPGTDETASTSAGLITKT